LLTFLVGGHGDVPDAAPNSIDTILRLPSRSWPSLGERKAKMDADRDKRITGPHRYEWSVMHQLPATTPNRRLASSAVIGDSLYVCGGSVILPYQLEAQKPAEPTPYAGHNYKPQYNIRVEVFDSCDRLCTAGPNSGTWYHDVPNLREGRYGAFSCVINDNW
jgi:hypothetical protein